MCITRQSRLLCRRLAKSLESSSFTFRALFCFVSCAVYGLAGFIVFSCGSVAPIHSVTVIFFLQVLRLSDVLFRAVSALQVRLMRVPPKCTAIVPIIASTTAKPDKFFCKFCELQPAVVFLILVRPRSYLKDVGIQHSLVPSLGD